MRNFMMCMIMLIIFSNCVPNPSLTPVGSYNFTINYQTNNGANLCDPKTSGHYDADEVNVFELINKNGVTSNEPSWQSCDNYVCTDGEGVFAVQFGINANHYLRGTVIQLSDTEADTLTYEIIDADGSNQVGNLIKTIYYKGDILWDNGQLRPHEVTIVK